MKLSLFKKYKSLNPFTIELPQFSIITGVNGAGKTHLLTSIYTKQLNLTENGKTLEHINYVSNTTLAPNNSVIATRNILNQNADKLWQSYDNYIKMHHGNADRKLTSFISDKQFSIIKNIAKRSNVELYSLTADIFYKYYPLEDGLEHQHIFHQNLSTLFKRYSDKFRENKLNKFLQEVEKLDNVTFLSSEHFIDLYGPAPWDMVNRIIKEANLDYAINSPSTNHPDAPFELKLISTVSNAEVNFTDLSSGEKVLMSLVLALYNSTIDIPFPEVLLMDEPDASLHPTMAKQFLDIIENVIVKEKGVKVVLTTHSPSTVALAKEETLFVVNKTGEQIEKTTKDKALKILTAGIPSFSVNYENRRQIFVESEYDVIFYEQIYQILSKYLVPEISLTFIASGESRTDKNGMKISNCGQVMNIAKALREAGNKFVWGIVDYDGKNQSAAYIKVLGEGKRYSIENYLFDPILLAALLLREKYILREDLGLLENESFIHLKNLDTINLQFIADNIISKIEPFIEPTDVTLSETILLNGKKIQIPNWYLNYNGHKLEDAILRAFPKLHNLKRNKEDALKLEIISKVMDEIPELISEDFLYLLSSIQED